MTGCYPDKTGGPQKVLFYSTWHCLWHVQKASQRNEDWHITWYHTYCLLCGKR